MKTYGESGFLEEYKALIRKYNLYIGPQSPEGLYIIPISDHEVDKHIQRIEYNEGNS